MTTQIAGYATAEGTERFAHRFAGQPGVAANDHYRLSVNGLMLSSLGMGTYLGQPDEATDIEMTRAAIASVSGGAINVLDTAINYRFQASERALGRALHQMIEAGKLARDEVFVCSKNGFLTPDAAVREDFRAYFHKTFIESGTVDPRDIVGGMHCMSPRYLTDQLDRSLKNLGLETLDLMYLHNAVESQMGDIGREAFMSRLKAAFEFYESARQDGRLRYYGLATWTCFRVMPDQEADYLNLETVVNVARQIGGDNHGFRFIQLPYNLAMVEALTLMSQTVQGESMTILEAATHLNIGVFTSVPLLQGQLLAHEGLPRFEGLSSPAQTCLQFARSTPGVLAPLAGHKRPAHVADNLQVAAVPPLSPEAFRQMFFRSEAASSSSHP